MVTIALWLMKESIKKHSFCIVFGVPLNNKLVVPSLFLFFIGRFMGYTVQRIVVPYAWVNVLVAKGCCSERYNVCKCIATTLKAKGA